MSDENQQEETSSPELTALIEETKKEEESEDKNFHRVLNIPVTVSMEVGRAKITIKELLKLNHGSVLELDRESGDPFDIFANGTLIAHGEVVIVNEKFGIRLTDVISTAERIEKLK